MRRVEYFEDPELEKTFPQQWCATAEILTKEGRKYFTKIEYPRGDPENPLSWDELIEKFYDLSGRLMPRRQRSTIVDQVRRLEQVRDMGQWSPLLLRLR
jgi:2-methylcitrate dehydratase PrpD